MWSRDIHHINHLLAIYVKLWQQCQSRNNHSIWMYFKQWASFKNQFWTTWVQEALHKWVSKHLSRSNLFEYVSSLLFSLFMPLTKWFPQSFEFYRQSSTSDIRILEEKYWNSTNGQKMSWCKDSLNEQK